MDKKESKLRALQVIIVPLAALAILIALLFCQLIDNSKVVQTEVVVSHSHYIDRDGNPAEAGENNGHIDEPPIVD